MTEEAPRGSHVAGSTGVKGKLLARGRLFFRQGAATPNVAKRVRLPLRGHD